MKRAALVRIALQLVRLNGPLIRGELSDRERVAAILQRERLRRQMERVSS